jgi:beta-lactamase class D
MRSRFSCLPLALLCCCLVLDRPAAGAAPAAPAAPAASKTSGLAVSPRPDWAKFFADAGVTGTLVILKDGPDDALTAQVHDPDRAATGFLPASTFKIPNSLIALETGVAAGPDTVFAWDGQRRSIEAWNKDLTLTEALRASSVPVYQEIARRIGHDRMQWWVKNLGYGNADIADAIDTFWLDGRLRISALEQAAFLRRLARGQLPLSRRSMDAVQEMMVEERTEAGVLRAKTGLTARVSPNVCWWVGWVEKGDGRWIFALNIDSVRPEDIAARKAVVKAVLAAEGIWP